MISPNKLKNCFVDENIDFKYPNNVEDFADFLLFFQER